MKKWNKVIRWNNSSFFVVFTSGYIRFFSYIKTEVTSIGCQLLISFVGYKLTLFLKLDVVTIPAAVEQGDNSTWRTD
jgi:hypothetical protein